MLITGIITDVFPEGSLMGVELSDAEGHGRIVFGEFRLTGEALFALMADLDAENPRGLEVSAETDGALLVSLAAA